MDLYYVVSSYRMGMAARAVLGVRGSSTVWTGASDALWRSGRSGD